MVDGTPAFMEVRDMHSAGKCVVVGVMMAAGLGGCIGYSNVAEETSQTPLKTPNYASTDPNEPGVVEIMTASLLEVIARRPAPGSAAIVNLPEGMRKVYYERVAESLTKATGVEFMAMSPEVVDRGLPVYSVGEVLVRYNRAECDVFAPTSDEFGQMGVQRIRVHLDGGLNPWRVVRPQIYLVNAFAAPEAHFIPEVDNPTEYQDLRKRQKMAKIPPASALEPKKPEPQPMEEMDPVTAAEELPAGQP
ncbi:MAG: hypothetical protein AB7Q00_03025 [Phycisphaerales bacterium]